MDRRAGRGRGSQQGSHLNWRAKPTATHKPEPHQQPPITRQRAQQAARGQQRVNSPPNGQPRHQTQEHPQKLQWCGASSVFRCCYLHDICHGGPEAHRPNCCHEHAYGRDPPILHPWRYPVEDENVTTKYKDKPIEAYKAIKGCLGEDVARAIAMAHTEVAPSEDERHLEKEGDEPKRKYKEWMNLVHCLEQAKSTRRTQGVCFVFDRILQRRTKRIELGLLLIHFHEPLVDGPPVVCQHHLNYGERWPTQRLHRRPKTLEFRDIGRRQWSILRFSIRKKAGDIVRVLTGTEKLFVSYVARNVCRLLDRGRYDKEGYDKANVQALLAIKRLYNLFKHAEVKAKTHISIFRHLAVAVIAVTAHAWQHCRPDEEIPPELDVIKRAERYNGNVADIIGHVVLVPYHCPTPKITSESSYRVPPDEVASRYITYVPCLFTLEARQGGPCPLRRICDLCDQFQRVQLP